MQLWLLPSMAARDPVKILATDRVQYGTAVEQLAASRKLERVDKSKVCRTRSASTGLWPRPRPVRKLVDRGRCRSYLGEGTMLGVLQVNTQTLNRRRPIAIASSTIVYPYTHTYI